MSATDDNTTMSPAVNGRATIACPFCALACDDLSRPVHNTPLSTEQIPCRRAVTGFNTALSNGQAHPQIKGRECTLDEAVEHARQLLQNARLPVIHGLVGDLQDCRAALHLAACFGGVVDHRSGDTIAEQLSVLQDSGWQITSLGEVRNRADLIVIVADRLDETHPRLQEKLFSANGRLHAEQPAEVVTLADKRVSTLGEVRALFHQRPLPDASEDARRLHRKMADARYPVILIGAVDNESTELVLRAASGLVRDLSHEQRAALLLLGGDIGSVSAQMVAAWHNGFGIRTAFNRGYPQQDLQRNAAARLLADGEADLMVWVGSLSEQRPPAVEQPAIVIGHPAMAFADQPPEVFLPVSVPGVQRAGFIHRADGLRMVPLTSIVDSGLPGSLDLCRQIAANHFANGVADAD